MNIYVAGNYKEDRHTVEDIATILERHHHHITHKWWDIHRAGDTKAAMDLAGVNQADVLVVYMEYPRYYRGTWVEIGYALAHRIPIYFIGNANSDLIFRQLPQCWDFKDHFPDAVARREVMEAVQ